MSDDKRDGYRTGAFVSAFPLDARFGLTRGFDEGPLFEDVGFELYAALH